MLWWKSGLNLLFPFLLKDSCIVQWSCRRICTVCNWKASLHCEPASVMSDLQLWCLSSRTGCNCGASSHDAESCAFWGLSSFWRRDCTEHTSRFWPFPLLNRQLLLFYKTRKRVGGELKMAETKFKVEWFLKSESNIIALSYLQLHGWKWWWWLSLSPIPDHNHNIQAIAWFTTKTSKYQYRDHLVGY